MATVPVRHFTGAPAPGRYFAGSGSATPRHFTGSRGLDSTPRRQSTSKSDASPAGGAPILDTSPAPTAPLRHFSGSGSATPRHFTGSRGLDSTSRRQTLQQIRHFTGRRRPDHRHLTGAHGACSIFHRRNLHQADISPAAGRRRLDTSPAVGARFDISPAGPPVNQTLHRHPRRLFDISQAETARGRHLTGGRTVMPRHSGVAAANTRVYIAPRQRVNVAWELVGRSLGPAGPAVMRNPAQATQAAAQRRSRCSAITNRRAVASAPRILGA